MLSLQSNYENSSQRVSLLYDKEGIRTASLYPFIPSSFIEVQDKQSSVEYCYEANERLSGPFLSIDAEKIPGTTIYNEIYLVGKVLYQEPVSAIQIFLNKELIVSKRPRLPFSVKMKRRIIQNLNELGAMNKIVPGLLQTEEENLIFSEVIKLDPGQNEITIEVFSESGSSDYKTFHVLRKKEEILGKKYRLCLSVLPIEDMSGVEWRSPYTERYVFRKLDNAFAEQDRFQVVERERLEEILLEHDISLSELAYKKQVVHAGRLLRAEIVFTSFMRLGRDSIELNGMTIDIETGKKFFPEDIYLEEKYFKNKDEMIREAVKILAMKARDNYPLCKGNILKKKGVQIIVDIGNRQRIGDHTKLVVYRKDDFGIKFLSEARVRETINEASSAAILLDKKKQEDVKIKDLVITK